MRTMMLEWDEFIKINYYHDGDFDVLSSSLVRVNEWVCVFIFFLSFSLARSQSSVLTDKLLLVISDAPLSMYALTNRQQPRIFKLFLVRLCLFEKKVLNQRSIWLSLCVSLCLHLCVSIIHKLCLKVGAIPDTIQHNSKEAMWFRERIR